MWPEPGLRFVFLILKCTCLSIELSVWSGSSADTFQRTTNRRPIPCVRSRCLQEPYFCCGCFLFIVCSCVCHFTVWPSHRLASSPSGCSGLTRITWVFQNHLLLLLLCALTCVSLYRDLIAEHEPQRSAWLSADCIILISDNVVVFWFCLSNQGRRFLVKKKLLIYT